MTRKTPADLRSARWFAPDDLRTFGERSRMMQLGYSETEFRGRPVIGILNTWSELNTCHAHFRERAQDVKRGLLMGGGEKTKPELVMGAISAGAPMSHRHAGPMLRGDYAGKTLSSGADARR